MHKSIVKKLITTSLILLISTLTWYYTNPSSKSQLRALASYITTPTRMQITTDLCAGRSRNTLLSSEDISKNNEYISSFRMVFKDDG